MVLSRVHPAALPVRVGRRPIRPAVELLENRLTPDVSLNLVLPPTSSYGVTSSLVLEYTNTGSSAEPAPLLVLSADKADLWLPTEPTVRGGSLQLLATAPSGPAGTLAPGAAGSMVVNFLATGPANNTAINFTLRKLDRGQTIDWTSIKSDMRPDYIPPDAWDAVFSNFTASVGSTTDTYQATLGADAAYLGQFDRPTHSVARLLTYQINKANNAFTTAPLGAAVDASLPTPGPSLSFMRWFQPTVAGHYRLGTLGRGWLSNWDITAAADADGNVTITTGTSFRTFTRQTDGSYLSALGDPGTLTQFGGGYRVTEMSGDGTVFNADGTLQYVEDTNGNRITATHSAGRLSRLTASNGSFLTLSYTNGRLTAVTDSTGRGTTYSYDAAGQHLLSSTDTLGTTTYAYVSGQGSAAEHALASIAFADSTHTIFSYDAAGRLIGQHRDNNQEAVSISHDSPGGYTATDAVGARTVVFTDDSGQVRKVIDPLGQVTRFTFNLSGDLTAVNDPLGGQLAYTYDLKGNLTGITNPLGQTTSFSHDAAGRMLSSTDARNHTTNYEYDGRGNLLSIAYPNSSREQFQYDPAGNVTRATNARGRAINYRYNAAGQVIEAAFLDGSVETYTYDSRGNPLTATNATGTIAFRYQSAASPDLVTEISYPNGQFLRFEYDTAGRRSQSVDHSGFTTNYAYDAASRLDQLTDGNGDLIVQYGYDAAGRLVQKDLGNGTRTTYQYDAAGNLLRIVNLAPDHVTINSRFDCAYDALGRVTSRTADSVTTAYGYDATGQLTALDAPGLSIRYDYDAAGNRVTETVNGVTKNYTANSVNQYTATGGTTYQYDLDGNLISKTDGAGTTTYSWNDANRLTAVSGPGVSATYTYDPLGHRNGETVNGTTTRFLIDPFGEGNVVAEYTAGGSLVAHYTHGLGLTSRVDASGSAAYYDFDLTGNTTGMTNTAGEYVNRYRYLPFGETTAVSAALPNRFTFVGEFGVMQDAPNLFAMRAREYTPETGQFLSNDPLGLGGGDANLRRYVRNSPVVLVDFSGEAPWSVKPVKLSPGTYGETHFERPGIFNLWNGGSFANRYNTILDYDQIKKAGFDWREVRAHEHLHTVYQDLYGRSLGGTDGTAEEIWVLQHYLAPKSKYGAPHLTRKYQEFQARKLAALLTGKYHYKTGHDSAVTQSTPPDTPRSTIIEGTPMTLRVYTGSIGQPITSAEVYFSHTEDASKNVSATNVVIERTGQGTGQYTQYSIKATVTFPETGRYGITVIVNGNREVVNPHRADVIVYDAPWIVHPVNFTAPVGGIYHGPIATFQDTNPHGNPAYYSAGWVNSSTLIPATIEGGGGFYTVIGTVDFSRWTRSGTTQLYVRVWDVGPGPNPKGGADVFDTVNVIGSGDLFYSTSVQGQIIQANKNDGDPPLVVIDTTANITSLNQVGVTVEAPANSRTPVPLITGMSMTRLDGVTRIVVEGVISALQPGAGLTEAAPLTIRLPGQEPLTARVMVNQTAAEYTLNAVSVVVTHGKLLQNVPVALLEGPENGVYSATIDWGDGETSPGQLTALGGGLFQVAGSKPTPYATAGTRIITVTASGPGDAPAPSVSLMATVLDSAGTPPPDTGDPPVPGPTHPVPPPPSPPPPAPRSSGITARLVAWQSGGKMRAARGKEKKRFQIEVYFADSGVFKSRFFSPFSPERFRSIRLSVRDGNGDGIPELIVLTARRGKKTVTALFPG